MKQWSPEEWKELEAAYEHVKVRINEAHAIAIPAVLEDLERFQQSIETEYVSQEAGTGIMRNVMQPIFTTVTALVNAYRDALQQFLPIPALAASTYEAQRGSLVETQKGPLIHIIETKPGQPLLSLIGHRTLYWFVLVIPDGGAPYVPDVFRLESGELKARRWAPNVLEGFSIDLGAHRSGVVCCFVSTRNFIARSVESVEEAANLLREELQSILLNRDHGFCFIEQPFGIRKRTYEIEGE